MTSIENKMVNLQRILTLLLTFVGAMSLIACSTSNTVTSAVSMSKVSTPRIITVLQDPW